MFAKRVVLSAIALGFIVDLAAATGEDQPVRLPLTLENMPPPRDHWYGIYFLGIKIGYTHSVFRRSSDSEGAFYVESTEELARISVDGITHERVAKSECRYEGRPPFAVVRVQKSVTEDGRTDSIEVTKVGDKRYKVVIRRGEDRQTKLLEDVDYTLADSLTPRLWILSKPKIGETIVCTHFDLEYLQTCPVSRKVLATKTTTVNGAPVRCYEIEKTHLKSGRRSVLKVDQDGNRIERVTGNRFKVVVEPEARAKTMGEGFHRVGAIEAKIDKPLGDPNEVVGLVLEVVGAGAAHLPNGPRQTLSHDPQSGSYLLKIGPDHGTACKATDKEVANNLEETVTYPISHWRVLVLAKVAVGDARTPREKVRRLVSFVHNYLESAEDYEPISVLELLEEKRGDCSAASLLFATLARCVGIPCREIGGVVYAGDELLGFAAHGWNEVVLDGVWVPVDASWGEVEPNATHIATCRTGADRDKVGLIEGKIAFKLREVTRQASRATTTQPDKP